MATTVRNGTLTPYLHTDWRDENFAIDLRFSQCKFGHCESDATNLASNAASGGSLLMRHFVSRIRSRIALARKGKASISSAPGDAQHLFSAQATGHSGSQGRAWLVSAMCSTVNGKRAAVDTLSREIGGFDLVWKKNVL